MHWYTWAIIAAILYVAITPIALAIFKIGGDADNRGEIQRDEHEGDIPL